MDNAGDKLKITKVLHWGQRYVFGGFATISGGFYGCTNLNSIAGGIISSGVQMDGLGYKETFRDCINLTTLPSNEMFNDAPSSGGMLTANAFYGTFMGSGLITIPTGLFDHDIYVLGFYRTFYGCNNLTSLPINLFLNNTLATNFTETFYGCNNLTLHSTIFYVNGQQATRFAGKQINFTNCFYLTTAFGGIKGTAPDLWNCTFGSVISIDCFQSHSFSSVTNYGSIPAGWK